MPARARARSIFRFANIVAGLMLALAATACSKASSSSCEPTGATDAQAWHDASSDVDDPADDDEDASVSLVTAWARWPMPNAVGLNAPNEARYAVTRVGDDEVVRDGVTGLVWQRGVGAQGVTWSEARRYCSELTLAGHHDWRLPSRVELVSLIDLTRSMELPNPTPAIDMAAFPETREDWFWSSSLKASDPDSAWYVYFYFGYIDTDAVRSPADARCVRTGLVAGSDERYDVEAGSVRDRGTGLTWQRTASRDTYSFAAATGYCADLNLDGAEDWRVPTLKELQTIIDEGRHAPALDSTVFPEASDERVWTSSVWAANASLAWYVEFDYGSGLYGLATNPYRVRCVH